jgi:hypothetical protein
MVGHFVQRARHKSQADRLASDARDGGINHPHRHAEHRQAPVRVAGDMQIQDNEARDQNSKRYEQETL